MALKPDRDYYATDDISHFWENGPATTAVEKGGVASLVTAGSGVSLDDTANVVTYAVDPSGAIPKGILLQDVNLPMSATRDYRNLQNGEIRPGEKCTLIRKGWLVTDMIVGSAPAAGDDAYLAASGNLSKTQAGGAPKVGKFDTAKDENGFAKVFIDL
jgi:hypothetical protein